MLKRKLHLRSITVIIIIAVAMMGSVDVTFGAVSDDRQAVNKFYNEKKNSLDGIYIGASAAYRYWAPTRAFKKHGMAVYCYGSNSMPISAIKYIIKDTLKTQNPEFIIVEVRNITKIARNTTTASIKSVTDYMPRSGNRGDTIEALRAFGKKAGANISTKSKLYYDPLTSLTSQSKNAKYKSDLAYVKRMGEFKGFPVTTVSGKRTSVRQSGFTTKRSRLESYYKSAMNSLLYYCDKLSCDVIFVANPHIVKSDRQSKINTALNMAKKRGYKTINLNRAAAVKTIGLNYKNDFYDPRHVNIKGAIKYTDYMAGRLDKMYKLTDHRGDANYDGWTNACTEFYKRYQKIK